MQSCSPAKPYLEYIKCGDTFTAKFKACANSERPFCLEEDNVLGSFAIEKGRGSRFVQICNKNWECKNVLGEAYSNLLFWVRREKSNVPRDGGWDKGTGQEETCCEKGAFSY